MSGGVDSSTVAGMMKKEGYKVIGITLKLYDDSKEVATSKQCCSGQDIMDAKRVAQKLNIEHKILYYQNKFKQGVIDNFVDSYLKGETPIPCVQCNQTVKFKDLFEVSKELNADAMITGHYVKSITLDNRTSMYRAIDENRDQSYFLFNTSKDQLNYLRFPLGGMLKDETREIAKQLELNVADKPDSQDICFVPNGDYVSVIQKFKPESLKKGNIKDIDGKVIGVHDGIINFTIGQRKGIKISDKDPLYVLKIDSEKNEIIVGPKEKLGKKIIHLRDLNLLVDKKELVKEIFVKVRSTGKLLRAKINIDNQNMAEVNLKNSEDGISPGQACVFYNKDKNGYKVLGGGWIKS
jgi:tRNA-specific 2-thiouridylase